MSNSIMSPEDKYLFDINRAFRNPRKLVRVNQNHILIYFPLDGFPDALTTESVKIRGRLFDIQREDNEASNNYDKWIIDEFQGAPATGYRDSFEEIVTEFLPDLVIEFLD